MQNNSIDSTLAGDERKLKRRNPILKFILSQSGFLIILIIVLSIIVGLLNPNFFRFQNFLNILQQNVSLGIIVVGVGFLCITGNFDISVGTMMSFIGIVVAMIITNVGSIPLAVIVGISMGFALGTLNGFIVAKSKAASFIITLGLLLAYRGAAVIVSAGFNFPLHGKFNWIGQGKLGGFFPVPILIFILIYILAYVILRFTKYGRILYVTGGNEKAAFVSGINVDMYKILTYSFCGALVGLATLILLSRLGSAYPNTGERYALDSLAAVVVGGTSLYGGKGSALGLLLGVIVFGLITNALNLININPYWRDAVVGIVIITAVVVGQLGTRRK